MSSFCKVIMMGNLTRDPEMRYTPSGAAIANFCVAVNRTWKSEDGQQHEEVSFIDCDAWGRTAETICQYFKKGKPIIVEGRLKQDTWDDRQTGQKRSKLKVVTERFTFVPGSADQNGQRQEAGGYRQPPRGQSSAEAPQPDAQYGGSQEPEEDVPF